MLASERPIDASIRFPASSVSGPISIRILQHQTTHVSASTEFHVLIGTTDLLLVATFSRYLPGIYETVPLRPWNQTPRAWRMSLRVGPDVSQAAACRPAVTLQVDGLTVHFGNRTLFRDISFSLFDRELLFVRGSSGTGMPLCFCICVYTQSTQWASTVFPSPHLHINQLHCVCELCRKVPPVSSFSSA